MNNEYRYTLFKCLLASFLASLKTPLGPCHTLYTTNTHAQWKSLMFDWCPVAQLDMIDPLYPLPRLSGAQFAVTLSVSTLIFMRRVRVTVTIHPFVSHLVRLSDAQWIKLLKWAGVCIVCSCQTPIWISLWSEYLFKAACVSVCLCSFLALLFVVRWYQCHHKLSIWGLGGNTQQGENIWLF